MVRFLSLVGALAGAAMVGGCLDTETSGGPAYTPPQAPQGLPMLNATCPTGISVHVDEGGPVFVNGEEATLEKYNDNFYEARNGDVVLSINRNPDGTMAMSYNRPGQNGICSIS